MPHHRDASGANYTRVILPTGGRFDSSPHGYVMFFLLERVRDAEAAGRSEPPKS